MDNSVRLSGDGRTHSFPDATFSVVIFRCDDVGPGGFGTADNGGGIQRFESEWVNDENKNTLLRELVGSQ